AVHVTIVEPTGKRLPDAGEQVTERAPSTWSFAVGAVYVTFAPFGPVASFETSGAEENTGPKVSATVTVKLAVDLLPLGSVAVQVTRVAPTGKNVLGGGEQLTLTPAFPSSIAVGGMKNTFAPLGPVACA